MPLFMHALHSFRLTYQEASFARLQEEKECRLAAEQQLGRAQEHIAHLEQALSSAQQENQDRCSWWPVTAHPLGMSLAALAGKV